MTCFASRAEAVETTAPSLHRRQTPPDQRRRVDGCVEQLIHSNINMSKTLSSPSRMTPGTPNSDKDNNDNRNIRNSVASACKQLALVSFWENQGQSQDKTHLQREKPGVRVGTNGHGGSHESNIATGDDNCTIHLDVPEWFQFDSQRSFHSQYGESLAAHDEHNNIHQIEDGQQRRIFTLYLIRHGEARHNVLEEQAKKAALQTSLKEGLKEDNPTTKERMEEARKGVLNDESLRDASLTDLGKEEAAAARERLHELIDQHDLPPPTCVLVSPLTRTLETCDIIFPDLQDIHVREGLSERRTLKPPDTRQPTSSLKARKSFSRFSMNDLARASVIRMAALLAANNLFPEKKATNPTISVNESWKVDDDENDSSRFLLSVEEKDELRVRTKTLFGMLGQTMARSIAVVSHKGWLRELEHGPFGQPESPLFKNCEIRTYRVKVCVVDNSLIEAKMIV